jgi:hypothetical protein
MVRSYLRFYVESHMVEHIKTNKPNVVNILKGLSRLPTDCSWESRRMHGHVLHYASVRHVKRDTAGIPCQVSLIRYVIRARNQPSRR